MAISPAMTLLIAPGSVELISSLCILMDAVINEDFIWNYVLGAKLKLTTMKML